MSNEKKSTIVWSMFVIGLALCAGRPAGLERSGAEGRSRSCHHRRCHGIYAVPLSALQAKPGKKAVFQGDLPLLRREAEVTVQSTIS